MPLSNRLDAWRCTDSFFVVYKRWVTRLPSHRLPQRRNVRHEVSCGRFLCPRIQDTSAWTLRNLSSWRSCYRRLWIHSDGLCTSRLLTAVQSFQFQERLVGQRLNGGLYVSCWRGNVASIPSFSLCLSHRETVWERMRFLHVLSTIPRHLNGGRGG